MVVFPMHHPYVLRHSSCLTLAASLIDFLHTLADFRLLVVSSQHLALAPHHFCPELNAAPFTNSSPSGAQSYFKFKVSQVNSSDSAVSLAAYNFSPWLPCVLELQDLPLEAHINRSCHRPLMFILGVSDRFNVLLQVGETAATDLVNVESREAGYAINLIYDASQITEFCEHLHGYLQATSSLATTFEEAIAGWSPQINHPELQSNFTLRLLTSLDAHPAKTDGLAYPRHSSNSAISPVSVQAPVKTTIYKQAHWLQQEKLLHELLHISSSSLDPQTILRRSAEVIRTIFNASRCLVSFYSPRDKRVIWGAISRAPELLPWDRQTHYPAWSTVERLIRKHHQLSTWVSDEFPLLPEQPEAASPYMVKAALSSWTQSHPKHADKWIGGFLCIEQWDRDRTWQSEEMYLLHMVIHQIEQILYQALLYQQAEERVQRAALLNRLIAQIRASLDLSHIFETVTMELGQLVVVDCCSIFEYQQTEHLWAVQAEYRLHSDAASAVGFNILNLTGFHIAQLCNLQTVQISDTRRLKNLTTTPSIESPGACLIVPIHYHQKLWGCISFRQDHYPRYWHESEVELLTAVANQLAIAIHQATLYQQIQQHNQTLEAQVAQRTAELERFFDTLPDYIFVVNRERMSLMFCNHAFAKSIGYEDRQQIQGRSIFECLPASLVNQFAEQNLRVFQSGQTLHEQETIIFPDGVRHLDTFKVPFKSATGEVYSLLGTSRDITELIETRQALSERTEQLQDALTAARKASQAKSEFLTTMSHELRTPLTSVIGMSSALLNQLFGPLTTKQSEYLRIIHNSGTHLLQLINDILDLSKIEAGKASLLVSQFSLREAAEQSLALFYEKAQSQNLCLHAELDSLQNRDLFMGDERRVKQILLNLLSNAVKFTPSGGAIWLRMSYDGTIAKIEVEDTGIGIAEDKLHLVFEAFQQIDSALNRRHEGTGLGLALTRQLVEMHNGSIHLKSTVGAGTVFTVYLQTQLYRGDELQLTEAQLDYIDGSVNPPRS